MRMGTNREITDIKMIGLNKMVKTLEMNNMGIIAIRIIRIRDMISEED